MPLYFVWHISTFVINTLFTMDIQSSGIGSSMSFINIPMFLITCCAKIAIDVRALITVSFVDHLSTKKMNTVLLSNFWTTWGPPSLIRCTYLLTNAAKFTIHVSKDFQPQGKSIDLVGHLLCLFLVNFGCLFVHFLFCFLIKRICLGGGPKSSFFTDLPQVMPACS